TWEDDLANCKKSPSFPALESVAPARDLTTAASARADTPRTFIVCDLPIVPSLRQHLFGHKRDLRDPDLFHHVTLVAFFAWVGLGADGLSSSAYGPEEAFKALGDHSYLAIFLAVAVALTVFIISYGYSRIIEHFPQGGGGYVVAS